MPRFPKRLLALGGLAAAGVAAARRMKAASGTGSATSDSEPAPPAAPASGPTPPAAQTAAAQPPVAPPPIETPGPSVTPPADPASDTEIAERAEATTPDPEILRRQAGGPIDELVEAETAAAAAAARNIGGPHYDDSPDGDPIDPAMEAVYEAGGGEQEGFELAERDLIENASHGGGHGDPSRDAFTPERESDESTALYGEPDEEKISEVVEDPTVANRDDDPGVGPGITHER